MPPTLDDLLTESRPSEPRDEPPAIPRRVQADRLAYTPIGVMEPPHEEQGPIFARVATVFAFLLVSMIGAWLWRDGQRAKADITRRDAEIRASVATQAQILSASIEEASKTAKSADEQSTQALKAAQIASSSSAQTELSIKALRQNQSLITGQLNSYERRLKDLEQRMVTPTISGTINAPSTQPKPVPPALGQTAQPNSIGSILDGMIADGKDLKRVRRPGSSDDSWLIPTSDGKTVDVKPWGASSDAVYVTDTVTGLSYRVDRKAGIAIPSSK